MKRSAAAAIAVGALAVMLSACQPDDEAQPEELRRGNGYSKTSQSATSTSASNESTSRSTTARTTSSSKKYEGAAATTCKDYKVKSDQERKDLVAAIVKKPASEVGGEVLMVRLGCLAAGADSDPIGKFLD